MFRTTLRCRYDDLPYRKVCYRKSHFPIIPAENISAKDANISFSLFLVEFCIEALYSLSREQRMGLT